MKNQTSPIGIVIVNTKSNFKNLNGLDLPLMEIYGARVTASVYDEQLDKFIQVDFNLNEVQCIFTRELDVQYANDIMQKNVSEEI